MSTPGTKDPLPAKRRPIIWGVAFVLVLVVPAAGLVVTAPSWAGPLVSPLSPGPFAGPASRSVRGLTDGITSTRYIVIGPPGQVGRLKYGLANIGRYPIRVDGLAGSHPAGITTVGWAPLGDNGEEFGGAAKDMRPFPVTIRPGDWTVLWVTVTKPHCRDGQRWRINEVPLRWSAFGLSHVYDLQLSETAGEVPEIALCHPDDALEHLEH